MAVPVLVSTDANSTSASSPIAHTIPAGWSAGDLVIALLYTSSRTVTGVPSGWAAADDSTTLAFNKIYAYWKVLVSGDLGASQSWTLSANPSASRIVFIRITGAHATTPINSSDGTADGSSGTTHVSPEVTSSVNDCLILRMMVNGGQATTASSGDTGSKEYEVTSTPGMSVWESSKATAGGTGTATYTTTANRQFAYITLAIAPAAGASGNPWNYYAQCG